VPRSIPATRRGNRKKDKDSDRKIVMSSMLGAVGNTHDPNGVGENKVTARLVWPRQDIAPSPDVP
jgi:hypothetical protein